MHRCSPHEAHGSTTKWLVIVTGAGLDAFVETDQLEHSHSGTVLAKTHPVTLTVARSRQGPRQPR